MQMTLLILLEFEIHYIIHINFDKKNLSKLNFDKIYCRSYNFGKNNRRSYNLDNIVRRSCNFGKNVAEVITSANSVTSARHTYLL
jgi:hypothetical protein